MSVSQNSKPIRLALIGGGWRAEFFFRIARALPEQFEVTGVMTRSAEKGDALTAAWGIPTVRTLDELLRGKPDYVVVSVPRSVAPDYLIELHSRNVPALTETPPAAGVDDLQKLWAAVGPNSRIQVAEQYIFQPLHAARLSIIASGKLGTVSQAQVSAAHGYHGISLIRHFLGIGYEDVTISGRSVESPLVASPGRGGPPTVEKVNTSRQAIASFDWGDRFGIYDFTGDQYFSWIRAHRVLIRGEKGEIGDETLRYLADFQTPVILDLRRDDTGHGGNLEGYFQRRITVGAETVYRNPFPGASLADDEIAVATAMLKMGEYAAGGPDFYSLAEGSQDHYLSLLMDQAIASGHPVKSEPQPWAEK